MSFDTLGLDPALLRALQDAGYKDPTEVQARAVPAAIAGRDLRVCSRTGSGKTAAFVLPALMRVIAARAERSDPAKREIRPASSERPQDRSRQSSGPRVLVLAPTRELAMQVSKAASTYGRHVQGLRVATVVGGVPYGAQLQALRGPLDILIATPGRLIDHLGSGKARLDAVEMLILDEADRMLDMGFIEDIEHIASSIPATRQTLMASATFAGAVGQLANRLQKGDVERIDIAGHDEQHTNIAQQLMWADSLDHKNKLLDHMLTEHNMGQALVFTSTQRDADMLANRLYEQGHAVAPLHGGMPQGRRTRTLMALRRGELRVLVATDVAARGIDVPTISHVINYGLPMKAEDYVHRIGRTGRAGRDGRAVTLAERRDLPMIRRIQHFTTQAIPVATVVGLEPTRPAPESAPRAGRPNDRGAFERAPFAGRPSNRPAPGRPGAPRGAAPRQAFEAKSPFGAPAGKPRFEGDGPKPAKRPRKAY